MATLVLNMGNRRGCLPAVADAFVLLDTGDKVSLQP
jgi:hypothetical protein